MGYNKITMFPRLKINLKAIGENYLTIKSRCEALGVDVVPVVKVVLGDENIVRVLKSLGARVIGDSRVKNIKNFSSIDVEKMLLRSPMLSEIEEVIEFSDISLNTEIEVVKHLSKVSSRKGRIHKVIVMVELGELREGIMPEDVLPFVKKLRELPSIEFLGIGTNLTCLSGVIPTEENLKVLLELKNLIEDYGIGVKVISGGGSNLLPMIWRGRLPRFINQIRVGEGIFLGVEAIDRKPLPGLRQDTFTLEAEVIEVKRKPSLPWGKKTVDAFGEVPEFEDKGIRRRAILALGRQDVSLSGIIPSDKFEIIGASSDHMVIDVEKYPHIKVGDIVSFNLNYAGVLFAMTSPFVEKIYIEE
ncbi:MAG: alanine/ornithine racemase family PLP-dependent enzyme [Caldiserica bacterium]|nr:MAG: alanine/ornithine racemase family PLP-dependent enzyme [Caldisericota bacterium]